MKRGFEGNWSISIICSASLVITGLLAWYDVFSFVDLKVYDEIYWPLRRPQISGKVLLVKIDRKSEQSEAFGERWRDWSHEDWLPSLTSALNTHELVGGKNNSVGIFIRLSKEERTGSISGREHLFWGTLCQRTDKGVKGIPRGQIPPLTRNLRTIAQKKPCFYDFSNDGDGNVRWAQLVIKEEENGSLEYSILIHLVKHYLKADAPRLDEKGRKIILLKDKKPLLSVPIDGQGRMLINFTSHQTIEDERIATDEFENISLVDLIKAHNRFKRSRLLDPTISQEDRDAVEEAYQEKYQGRVALVGLTTSRPTRFQTPTGEMLHLMVEANALNTILSGRFIAFLGNKGRLGILSVLCLFSVISFTIWAQKKVNPIGVLFVGGGLLGGYLVVALLFFGMRGTWWGVMDPFLSVALSSIGVFVFFSFSQLKESLERIQAQQTTLIKTYAEITKGESEVANDVDFNQITTRLEEYHRELERRNEARLRMIAHAPHDLNMPLNALISLVNLCTDKLRRTETLDLVFLKESLAKIKNNATEALLRIRDILDMYAMQAGKFQFKIERIQPNFLIEKVVQTLKPTADQKKVSISMPPGKIPMLKADPRTIERVVDNLLSNAIKFTPQGGRITISTADKSNSIEICVEDTGPGIPTDISIFEPYVSTTKSTGIGLSLAKGIIELHGGQIKAENKPNGGSRFTFSLPKS